MQVQPAPRHSQVVLLFSHVTTQVEAVQLTRQCEPPLQPTTQVELVQFTVQSAPLSQMGLQSESPAQSMVHTLSPEHLAAHVGCMQSKSHMSHE